MHPFTHEIIHNAKLALELIDVGSEKGYLVIVHLVSLKPTEFCHKCLVQRRYQFSLLNKELFETGYIHRLLSQVVLDLHLDAIVELVHCFFHLVDRVLID